MKKLVARSRRNTRLGSDESGMSLIELVVAISIFAIVMTGVAATLAAGLALTRTNQHRSVAANLASQEMDTIRASDFSSLVDRSVTQKVGGITYTIYRSLTWVAHNASNGPCDGVNTAPEVLRVHVGVDWPRRRGAAIVTSDSVITPPIGAYNPQTGHIAVRVLNRDAQPSAFTGVLLAGGTSRSALTNAEGCAFFAFLPAGTYNVSMNSAGYVDRQGNTSPTQIANVAIGNVTSAQFDYDRQGTIAFTIEGPDGALVPANVPLTIGNTTLLPSGTRTYSGTGTSRTITGLFPSLDGYETWAGSCADADPEGVDSNGTAYHSSGVRSPAVPVAPGSSGVGNVDLALLDLQIQNSNGTPVSGASLIASHTPDAKCTAGESYTIGTTGSDGTIKVLLPFGTWSLGVFGRSVVGGQPSTYLSPTSTGNSITLVLS